MTLPPDMREFNGEVAAAFRAQHGAGPLAGGRLDAARMLLLTTVGARTGERRTTPLGWLRVDGALIVMASNVGAPKHPGWYHNLLAEPRVTVELGEETCTATARVPSGAEHDRLWRGAVEQLPFYADHQANTTRRIPVVVLERT